MSFQKVASSTVLYWAMIEGGLAVIAACLPTVRIVVGTASLSSILHRLRSALGWSSVHSQNQELQQISRRFPPCSEESYTQIDSDSSPSLAFCLAREMNENPINISSAGSPNGFSEPESHGIQITGQFSQRTSIVWTAIALVKFDEGVPFFSASLEPFVNFGARVFKAEAILILST